MATPATQPTKADLLEKARTASANLECVYHHRPFDVQVTKSLTLEPDGASWQLLLGVAVKCPVCWLQSVRLHPATTSHYTHITTARKEQGANSAFMAETERNLLQDAATRYNVELVESSDYDES